MALVGFDRHPQMGSKWDRKLWAKGYFVTTVGELTEDAVRTYIEAQEEEDKKEVARK